jgi:hypothetical protein
MEAARSKKRSRASDPARRRVELGPKATREREREREREISLG